MRFKNYLLLLSLVALGAVGCSPEAFDDPEQTNPTDPDNPEVTGYTLTYEASEYDPDGFTVAFYTDYSFTQQVTSAEENTTVFISLGAFDYTLYSIKTLYVNGESITPDPIYGEYSLVVGTENVVVTIDWSLLGLFNQFLTDNFGDGSTQNYSLYRTRYSRTVALDSDTFEETGEATIEELTPYTPYNSYVDGIVIKSEYVDDSEDVQYVIYNEDDGWSWWFYLNDTKTDWIYGRSINDCRWNYQAAQTYNCYYDLYKSRVSFEEQSTNVYKQTGDMYANYLYNLIGAGYWYDWGSPEYDDSKEYPIITFHHINNEIKIEAVTYSIVREAESGGYERYQEVYECTIKNIGTTEVNAVDLIALMNQSS